MEECCVDVQDPVHVGKIIFEFVGDSQLLEVHVFRAEKFTGTPKETDGILHSYFQTKVSRDIKYERKNYND